MSECTHDCSTCSQNCESRKEPSSLLEKTNELSHVKKVIGVVSGKGGVGKSMVTAMLAVLMNRNGFSAAILDADITGPSIPKAFGIHERAQGSESGMFPAETKTGIKVISVNMLLEHEDDPVIWRGPVLAGVVKQFWSEVIWDEVDYLFVDMPPGTGDVPLTVFQSIPLDGIVVVTSPQDLVSMIVGKAVKMANMMDIPIVGMVENYSYFKCPDCGKIVYPFGEGKLLETAEKYHLPILGRLPIDPALATCADTGTMELFEGDFLDDAVPVLEAVEQRIKE